jgi:two-component system sensor histidine kinase PilS (NtrC family)
MTTDADLRVLTFNRAAATITGLSVEQVVGQDAGEILQLPASIRGRLRALGQTGRASGRRRHRAERSDRDAETPGAERSDAAWEGHAARSVRVDIEFRAGDGRLLDVGLTAATVSFPNGRSGYLFTFQDVTDVKRLERHARLQQRLAAVGEMAAGIAHEIRNPLASMSGSIQVLRQELPLSLWTSCSASPSA